MAGIVLWRPGGDAQYGDHATTIQVQDGTSDRLLTLVQDYQPAAAGQFWTVELDDKVVPPADGLGANPTFVPQADSGTLEVSQGYIRLMQRVGTGRVAGGDLSLLEVWRIDEAAPAPLANFSAFPTSGTLPLTVQFFDNSTGAESYLWDFGDTLTSTQSSPSHTYTLPGVYTVTLTVAGSGPSDTLTRPGYITVTAPVTADFSAEPLAGPAPLVVTFTNSSANATEYVWAYGDGITSTITATNHVYTYTQAGVYTVTLWAGNGAITVPLTRPGYITVTGLFTRNWQLITPSTTQPPVAGEHGLAYDADRGVVVLYGGNADGWPYENSTWEFDGTDWISVTTTTTPAARYGAGLAYDNGSGSTILFGGSDETDTALAQTWEYTNTEWSQVFPATSPLSRTYPCLVAAPTGAVYLFGGNDGAQAYNDLWEYDSGDWNLLPVGSEAPQARTLAAMTYVSSPPPGGTEGGHLLLFGGRSLTGAILSDFWAYNFSTSAWSQIDPGGGPPARMAHSLTYDPATGNTVLVGGIALDGETVLTDTWHYNGGWSEVNPSAAPPRPAYHQAVYHDQAIILVSEGEVWKYE